MESAMNNDEPLDPLQENTADDMPTLDDDVMDQPEGTSTNDEVVNESTDESATEDVEILDEPLTPEEELAEANAKVLRITAEMENIRKRMQKEVSEARRYASTGLISCLLYTSDAADE